MRSILRLTTVCFVFSQTLVAVAGDTANTPQPPETQLVVPTKLITAEAFERAEGLAAKGKPGWHGGIGEWQVKDGVLHAKDEAPSAARPNGHEGVCEFVTEFGDAVITAEFRLGKSPQVGVVCRDTQQPNHHLGRVLVTQDKVWIQKMDGIAKQTTKEILQTINTPFDPNQWYRITLEISGDEFLAHIGPHTLSGKNDRFKEKKGRVGLIAKGEGAQFRNVAVWAAEPKR